MTEKTTKTVSQALLSLLLSLLLTVAVQKHNVYAEGIAISIDMFFLRADESSAYGGYREGDTAIIVCRASDPVNGGSFDVARFEWLQFGSTSEVTIADINQITFFDGRDRFSGANLTYIEAQNLTDYRITVSDLDRYDSGNRFFCTFGRGTLTHSIAKTLEIRWDPPSAQCSSSVNTTKPRKGENVFYSCNVTDTDLRSNGQISLFKDEARLSGLTIVRNHGIYYVDYSTQITDDSVTDVYTCRYTATGGFEDYSSNCTFNRPSCVVDDLVDECTPSSGHSSIALTTARFLLVMIKCLLPVFSPLLI